MAYMTNSNTENFGTVAGNVNVIVSHYSLILRYGESDALLLLTDNLTISRTYVNDDPIELPAGALDINFPAGDANDAAVLAAYNALLAGRRTSVAGSLTVGATMLLGTGAMGAGGVSNEVTDSGYARKFVELTTGLGNAPGT